MFNTHNLRREAHGSPEFSNKPAYETRDKPRRIFPPIYHSFPEPEGATQRELDRLGDILKVGPPADYQYKPRRRKNKKSSPFLKRAVYALIGFGLIALCANDCSGHEMGNNPKHYSAPSYLENALTK